MPEHRKRGQGIGMALRGVRKLAKKYPLDKDGNVIMPPKQSASQKADVVAGDIQATLEEKKRKKKGY
jgi:hypothetical protein